MIKNKITFPESFIKTTHPLRQGYQWVLKDGEKVLVSIVGGRQGLYGDGIKTFEMWDFNEDQPQGYLSIEEINIHLNHAFNDEPIMVEIIKDSLIITPNEINKMLEMGFDIEKLLAIIQSK